jgi:hypothetical protein
LHGRFFQLPHHAVTHKLSKFNPASDFEKFSKYGTLPDNFFQFLFKFGNFRFSHLLDIGVRFSGGKFVVCAMSECGKIALLFSCIFTCFLTAFLGGDFSLDGTAFSVFCIKKTVEVVRMGYF